MPELVEYPLALAQLQARGFRCLYHNSGAIGFPSSTATESRGWIGDADASIRDTALPLVRQLREPIIETLLSGLTLMRENHLPGRAWMMPKSHWAFEFEFGSREWMPSLIADMGIDPLPLTGLNNAAPIEFSDVDNALLGKMVATLLANLRQSDFSINFPDSATVCTVHSHQQLWWTTANPAVAAGLDTIAAGLLR